MKSEHLDKFMPRRSIYLAIHKVFGRIGAKTRKSRRKLGHLGAGLSEYFMNCQVSYLGITKQKSSASLRGIVLSYIGSFHTIPPSSPGMNALEVIALLRRRNCCLSLCLDRWIDGVLAKSSQYKVLTRYTSYPASFG